MPYNLRLPNNNRTDEESGGDDHEILRQTQEDVLEQAEAALEKAEKPDKMKGVVKPSPSTRPSLKPFQQALRSLKQINSPSKRSTPNPVNRTITNPSGSHSLKRPTSSSADAKEIAKKLVLAGKIAIQSPSKSQEEKKGFKRPTLEKKIASGLMNTGGGGATPTVGVRRSYTLEHHVERGDRGSSHTEGTSPRPRPVPIMMNDVEVPKTRPFIIPRLDEASYNNPKRGPAIYVCLKNEPVTQAMLRSIFERFGRIFGIRIGRYMGVAFVTFTTIESAERAINEMNGTLYNGVPFEVEFAWRQPQRPPPYSNQKPTVSATQSSTSPPKQSRSWDYKRRGVVDDDDEEI